MDSPQVPGLDALVEIESPEGIRCWQQNLFAATVSIVIEEPAVLEDLDPRFVGGIVAQLPQLLAEAALAVEHSWGVTPSDPEVTFWVDREWTVRFAEVDTPELSELGAAVWFVDMEITDVDNLLEDESAGSE